MIYKFSNFTLDRKNFTLKLNSKDVLLEPKVFSLLCFFCLNAGKAVSREMLISNVWDNRVVSDAAINRAISELRKVLPADSIETIPKVGYRFKHEVKVEKYRNYNIHAIFNFTKSFLFILFLTFITVSTFLYLQKSHASYEVKVKILDPLDTQKDLSYRGKYSLSDKNKYYLSRVANSNSQIWQYSASSDLRITNDEFYYLDFVSIEKQKIIASRYNNLNERKCEIVIIDPNHKNIQPLLPCAARGLIQLDYDDKRKRLFFNHRLAVNSPYSVYSFELNSKRLKQHSHALNVGNAIGDFAFDYDKQSNQLIILEYLHSGSFQLKQVDLDTAKQTNILKFSSAIDVAWYSDSLVLVSQRNKTSLVDINSKSILQELDIKATKLDVNTTRNKLLTHNFEAVRNIYKSSNNTLKKLTLSERDITDFVLSQRGELLVYKTGRHANSKLWVEIANSKAVNITPDAPLLSISSLKLNSSNTTLAAVIDNTLKLYDFHQNEWKQLTEPNLKVHHIGQFSTDKITFSANLDSDWQIYSLQLKDKSLKQITKLGGYSSQSSNDAQTLVFSKFNEDGLFALSEDGNEKLLYAGFKLTSWKNWQLIEDKIYIKEGDVIKVIQSNTGELLTENEIKGALQINFTANQEEYFVLKSDRTSSKIFEYAINSD